jgi:pimeloyl-ACP methyl ester carboxylesterase
MRLADPSPGLQPDPAALAAAARRQETPCGPGSMAWRSWGEGVPVVLAHGGHGAWSHWIRTIPVLARRFRVIAPDLPGHGDSATPPEPHSAAGLGAIMAEGLRRVLAPGESCHLVGFSFGAVIAGAAAAELPGRVRQFVLVGAGGLDLPRAPRPELSRWRGLDGEDEKLRAHRENLAALMFADPAHIDALALELQAANTARARIRTHLISRTDALKRALPLVAAGGARLAGIWGSEDATARGFIGLRRELLRGIDPGAAFTEIEGAGHWVQYEAAAAFAAALAAILDRPLAG